MMDIDGDNRSDMVVWRPSDGTWYALTSSTGFNRGAPLERQWGTDGDIPLSGNDFDGDGADEMMVWRPSDGTWYALLSTTGFDRGASVETQWGTAGDVPLSNMEVDGGGIDNVVWRPDVAGFGEGAFFALTSGSGFDRNAPLERPWGRPGDILLPNTDFDGDGRDEMAVWRPSDGTLYARLSGNGFDGFLVRQWGTAGDIPLPNTNLDGGTGTPDDIVVWRPSDGTWYARLSSRQFDPALPALEIQWGTDGDIPLPDTDLDGDDIDDLVVWRPSDGTWYALLSTTGFDRNAPLERQWGTRGDTPLSGTDFDGDGTRDMAVWRPSNGTWYVLTSGTDFDRNAPLERQWGANGDELLF